MEQTHALLSLYHPIVENICVLFLSCLSYSFFAMLSKVNFSFFMFYQSVNKQSIDYLVFVCSSWWMIIQT